jgi:alpha-beta hydrolase superfamily lysophospholipase
MNAVSPPPRAQVAQFGSRTRRAIRRWGLALVGVVVLVAVASKPLEELGATAAVLIIHGSADAKIPVAQSRAIAAAGTDHTTLVVVEGAGHDDVMDSRGANLAVRAPAWFDAHLRYLGAADGSL